MFNNANGGAPAEPVQVPDSFRVPDKRALHFKYLVCKIVDSVRPDSVSVLTNLRLFVECEVIGEGLLG